MGDREGEAAVPPPFAVPSSPLCPGAESLVHFCSSGHSAGRVFLDAFWLTDEPSATIAGSSSFPEECQGLGLDFSKMTTSDLFDK